MHFFVSTLKAKAAAGRAGLALVAAALCLASCKNETMPAPETGKDFYPIAVGNFWTYAVVDTTWSQATGQGSGLITSVPTATVYEFKETINETFTDAAGKTAYRMVRSVKVPPSTTFRNDSVFVLSATDQFVALNRNNTRTLELIFPVREGRSWNLNAFNNNFNDTITAETRQYSRIGEAFTTAAVGSAPAQTYAETLTTKNTGAAAENSLVKRSSYQQVFAKGVGPVFRRRVNILPYTYVDFNGNQVYPPGAYTLGFSREETLIDYGPR
ncbi:hypothetical protein I2I05_15950 [Hymenobacter sp. BT683]|uniref:DUF4397 domain-containing protein n=1 Tax=Hymenobacter jeongseonensis TaxID=2791027 RepID=A0ABS0IKJ4_9BACT|nr:hypothetical protein [Hymenobacter jeongseonensis]MBF9238897.1 hypothetical protein [Hymenobacter jeongseonensis]